MPGHISHTSRLMPELLVGKEADFQSEDRKIICQGELEIALEPGWFWVSDPESGGWRLWLFPWQEAQS
jgi:hypothetical protein